MRKAIIVCGRPGAGKSTYAKTLALSRSAALIDVDSSTERLVRLALELLEQKADDRDSPFFKNTFREQIYEALFDAACINLLHIDTVIVGPFTKELGDPDWPSRLQQRLHAEVEIHYLYCHSDIRQQRLKARGNPRDSHKLTDWNSYLRYYGKEDAPPFPHIFIDTSKSERS